MGPAVMVMVISFKRSLAEVLAEVLVVLVLRIVFQIRRRMAGPVLVLVTLAFYGSRRLLHGRCPIHRCPRLLFVLLVASLQSGFGSF